MRPMATSVDDRRRQMMHRGLLAVAWAIIALGTGQMFHGAVSTGYSFDEETHVQRLQNWFDSGWYLPDAQMDDVADGPARPTPRQSVYGPAFALLAHGANVAVGNESFSQLADSAAANDVRHLAVALLGLVGAGAVGTIAWLLTRSSLVGAWSAATMLSLPRWVGHAMFNIKDVPVATGYTLATLSLVIGLTSLRREASRSLTAALAGLAMFFGVLIGVGTRTGMWVLISLSVASYGLLRSLQLWSARSLRPSPEDVGILLGGLTGLASVFALSPRVARTPLAWFYQSIQGSSDFPWSGFTLTAGRLLDENPVWWYLPTWVGATTPVLLGLAFLLGLTGLAVALSRQTSTSPARDTSAWVQREEVGWLLVVQQLLLGPAAAIALQTVMYNGLRQHLYMLPALAAIAGYGAWWLLHGGMSRWSAGSVIASALLALALVAPTVDQLRLHPFQYVYVNLLAGEVDGRWEADYWFVGAREAIQRIPADEEARCSNWMVRPWDPEQGPGLRGGCGRGVGPYTVEQGIDTTEAHIDEDEFWVIGRTRGGNRPPDYCREVDNVTRPLRTHDVTVAYVLACPVELPGSP